MKKTIKILVTTSIIFLLFISTASAITMYAPDGRTSEVEDVDVAAWKKVGWYDYPVTTVYAPDGRSQVISTSALEDWLNVG